MAIMASERGWSHVREFIENRIRPYEKELNENFDLTKEEFNILQARRQELNEILSFVDRRLKLVIKENQGG